MRRAVYTAVRRVQRAYWRIAKPRTRGVRAIVVDDRGRVILVRHTYEAASTWYLPGGGVRRSETFEQAVVRELREEVGVSPEGLELFGRYTNTAEGKRDDVRLFVVRTWHRDDISSAEVAAVTFVDPTAPPDATSPATLRRLAEFTGGTAPAPVW